MSLLGYSGGMLSLQNFVFKSLQGQFWHYELIVLDTQFTSLVRLIEELQHFNGSLSEILYPPHHLLRIFCYIFCYFNGCR